MKKSYSQTGGGDPDVEGITEDMDDGTNLSFIFRSTLNLISQNERSSTYPNYKDFKLFFYLTC